jgi:flagellar motor switch protein FliM
MSNSLGAYLRAHFQMVLASVELIPGRDFLGSFQETGFTSFLAVQPGSSAVVLQVDTALVVPIIDVLLGGSGQSTTMSRELTEIDREIMDGVAQMIGRELETTWQSIGVKLRPDRQRQAAQIQSVYSATEKLTILSFEAKVNETPGAITISFPATLAIAMLREISPDPGKKPHAEQPQSLGVRASVLNCPFETTVGLANLKVPLRELMALRPGSVLNLRLPVKVTAALLLGGREWFEAVPVRSGNQRAAQLVRLNGPPANPYEEP